MTQQFLTLDAADNSAVTKSVRHEWWRHVQLAASHGYVCRYPVSYVFRESSEPNTSTKAIESNRTHWFTYFYSLFRHSLVFINNFSLTQCCSNGISSNTTNICNDYASKWGCSTTKQTIYRHISSTFTQFIPRNSSQASMSVTVQQILMITVGNNQIRMVPIVKSLTQPSRIAFYRTTHWQHESLSKLNEELELELFAFSRTTRNHRNTLT